MTAIPDTFRAYVAERSTTVSSVVSASSAKPTCRRARSRSGSNGRASTSRTASRRSSTARWPGSARSSRASISRGRLSRARTRRSRSVRTSLRTGTTWVCHDTWLRRVPARAAGWVVPLNGLDGQGGDGDRHRRLHGRHVGRRARGARPDPGDGPVLVTGASGGVGGTAVAILGQRGYEVWAVTGKDDEIPRLRELGATGFLTRDEVTVEGKPLESARWAAPSMPSARPRCRTSCGRSGRAPRWPRAGTPAGRSSMPRSCRSSCGASRCSAWIPCWFRSNAAARSGIAWRPTCGPARSVRDVIELTLDTLEDGARRDRRRRRTRALGSPGRLGQFQPGSVRLAPGPRPAATDGGHPREEKPGTGSTRAPRRGRSLRPRCAARGPRRGAGLPPVRRPNRGRRGRHDPGPRSAPPAARGDRRWPATRAGRSRRMTGRRRSRAGPRRT